MIGSSRFRSLNHHGGLTFHYRRIFYDNQSMDWSGQQINGWQLFSTLCWWKLQVYPCYTVWQWSVVCSCQGCSLDFKLACLLYFLFPDNVGLGFEVHQRTVASRYWPTERVVWLRLSCYWVEDNMPAYLFVVAYTSENFGWSLLTSWTTTIPQVTCPAWLWNHKALGSGRGLWGHHSYGSPFSPMSNFHCLGCQLLSNPVNSVFLVDIK